MTGNGYTDHHYAPAAAGIEKIRDRWVEINSMAGVGIDPDVDKIPDEIWDEVGGPEYIADGVTLFSRRVIDATADLTADFKVNSSFFQGEAGRRSLADTFAYMKAAYPGILRICDGKFGDVGHTAEKIAEEVFGNLDADAVVLNPYLGSDAIKPFADWGEKIVILCVNTSNPSAEQIQNQKLANGSPLWRYVLDQGMHAWNDNGNVIPVLSATHPENLEGIREVVGDTPILLAGVGTQGGSVEETVPRCLDSNGYGLMIGASRSILYPDRQPEETAAEASRRVLQDLSASINRAKATQ